MANTTSQKKKKPQQKKQTGAPLFSPPKSSSQSNKCNWYNKNKSNQCDTTESTKFLIVHKGQENK